MGIFLQSINQYLSVPLINLIIATILGALAAIATDKLQTRVKRIWWATKSTSLNDDYFSETGKLKILYKKYGNSKSFKRIMGSLSVCRFIFWSNSTETLLGTDISTFEPLVINLSNDCEVLEVRTVTRSNTTLTAEVISPHQVKLSFEYLEKRQGAVFDIVYEGYTFPLLTGVIKGGKVITKEISSPLNWNTPRLYLLFGWLKPAHQTVALRLFFTIGFISAFWLFLSITPGLFMLNSSNWYEKCWGLPPYLVSGITSGIMTWFLWNTAIVPIELQEFYTKIK